MGKGYRKMQLKASAEISIKATTVVTVDPYDMVSLLVELLAVRGLLLQPGERLTLHALYKPLGL